MNKSPQYREWVKANKEADDVMILYAQCISESKLQKVEAQKGEMEMEKKILECHHPSFRIQHHFLGLPSRNKAMSEVLEALKDDSIIGIWGMGGIGKTTLMHEVCKRARERKLFDDVLITYVPENQDLVLIQSDLAKQLGLPMIHNVASIYERADCLRMKLTAPARRVLIVLDDVWEPFDLDEVGIPVGPMCKVLLTSRRKDVCMQMGTGKGIIQVETLSREEAWNLFKWKLGDVVERDDIRDLARNIADSCKGLPLALVTLAMALSNKNRMVWQSVYKRLNESEDISFYGVSQAIKLSINHLPSEARKLLLLCCQFPDGYVINVEKLASNLALGLSGVSEVNDARNRFFDLIECLKSQSLLLEGDVNDDSEDQTVMVRDIVRDVVLSIVSEMDTHVMGERSVTLKEDGFVYVHEHVQNEFSDPVESVVHEHVQNEGPSLNCMKASVGAPAEQDLAHSSGLDLNEVAEPSLSGSVPSALTKPNVPSTDSQFSTPYDDWNSKILVNGVYVKAEMKTTLEEILRANPNFLSKLQCKGADTKTFHVESAIRCLENLRQCTACTISPQLLACIEDSLYDLEAIGLDMDWLKRGYKRASLMLEKQNVVSALAKLARLEKERAEAKEEFETAKEKFEHLTVLRDASKAECDALMQEEKATGNELFGGGFSIETSLGDGLLE